MSYQPLPTHDSSRTELRIEDDFCFKNNVLNADKEQRLNFLRKVYAILCAQIGLTSLICGLSITNLTIKSFIQSHIDLVPMVSIVTFMVLIWLHVERKNYPRNFYLLGAFTVLQSFSIAAICTLYDSWIVIKAAVLTTVVFGSLTMYTFNSKKDYSSWGAGLFSALWIMIVMSFMHVLFFRESEIAEEIMASFGAGLFCLFIIFDTHMIMKRLSPEEYIVAAINLYLDIINLFLELLRLMGEANRR